jgi:uncharacterized protein YndB with AHSA1/START domain
MTATFTASETLEYTWKAPLEQVWGLWTTKAGIEAWYGPSGFRTDVQTLEIKAGGQWLYTMTAVGEQQVAWMTSKGRPLSMAQEGTFLEVVHHERLVFELTAPTGPGTTTTMRHTVTFEPIEGAIRMVFHIEAEAEQMLKGAVSGWKSSMGRMAAKLS